MSATSLFSAARNATISKGMAATASAWSSALSTGHAYFVALMATMAAASVQAYKSTAKTLGGASSTMSGAVTRSIGKSISAQLSGLGVAMNRTTAKGLAAVSSFAVGTQKSISRVLSAVIASQSGSLAHIRVKEFLATCAAFSVSVARSVSKEVSATPDWSVVVHRQISKVLSALPSPFAGILDAIRHAKDIPGKIRMAFSRAMATITITRKANTDMSVRVAEGTVSESVAEGSVTMTVSKVTTSFGDPNL